MPKVSSSAAAPARRHNPLETDIVGGSGILRPGGKKSKTKASKEKEEYVEAKQSARILRLGQQLADEEDGANIAPTEHKSAFDPDSRFAPDEDEQDDGAYDDDAWGDDDDEVEVDEAEISPEDLAMFNKFMSADEEDPLLKHGWDLKAGAGEEEQQQGSTNTNLADLIMNKIQAFESGAGERGEMSGMDDFPEEDLPPKVVEVYSK